MVARYDRPMQSSRPLVVVVSGAPATGKTTLARRLAPDVDARLLSKDGIKEALADEIGLPRNVAESSRLGDAAYAALFALLRSAVEAGNAAVVEANFRRGRSEDELSRALNGVDLRQVHCTAAPERIRTRYHGRTDRHPAHLDRLRIDDVAADMAAQQYAPLSLDGPMLVVETDDGYTPPYDAIRAFVIGVTARTK